MTIHSYFAVLGEDSDFTMMNVPYIPLSSLQFDGERIQAQLFTPKRISEVLSIPCHMFCAFATLAGNDFVSVNDLSSFHRSELRKNLWYVCNPNRCNFKRRCSEWSI